MATGNAQLKSSESEESAALPTGGRRDRHKAAIRERLYRAAIDLYMTRGLQATTVRDITEAADVGKGTFFNYFPTKEHLLAEFYARQSGRAADDLRALRDDESFRDALMRMRRRASREAAQSPALTRSFLLALVSNQTVFEMVMPHLLATRRAFEQMYEAGQKQGLIRTDRPAAELARVIQELAFGTALFWICRPDTPLDELLDANVEIVCALRQSAATGSADGTSNRFRIRPHGTPKRSRNSGRGSKSRSGRVPA